MDSRVTAVRSGTGGVCTIIMLLIVGAFSYLKLLNLIYQKDIYLAQAPEYNFFDAN